MLWRIIEIGNGPWTCLDASIQTWNITESEFILEKGFPSGFNKSNKTKNLIPAYNGRPQKKQKHDTQTRKTTIPSIWQMTIKSLSKLAIFILDELTTSIPVALPRSLENSSRKSCPGSDQVTGISRPTYRARSVRASAPMRQDGAKIRLSTERT